MFLVGFEMGFLTFVQCNFFLVFFVGFGMEFLKLYVVFFSYCTM